MKSNAGVSLVELLVSSAIMLIVFAMVSTGFIQTRKLSERNNLDAEILQNARIGLDEMTRQLRMIGYRRDTELGQVALLEAAPFQIIFNADIYANKSALPAAMPVHLYDGTDYISPLENYTTHAETIRWTLDSSDDGIVDGNDIDDNFEERNTRKHPNDMALIQEIMNSAKTSRWRDNVITFGMLGPYDRDDRPTYLTPLFQYWLLEDDLTFSLLGDTNNDLQLQGAECYFRSITSQDILRKVRRIQISVTVESDAKDPLQPTSHRRISLSTQVGIRNAP